MLRQGEGVRCFLALWPDAQARAALDALAAQWHQRFPETRRMRAPNLHLTLAFIGRLERPTADVLAQALQQFELAPFTWTLNRLGVFPSARVLWAGGPDSDALTQLSARCRTALDPLNIVYDRKPFKAHVTLLRDVPRDVLPSGEDAVHPPVHWPVLQPRLIESVQEPSGVRYRDFPVRFQS